MKYPLTVLTAATYILLMTPTTAQAFGSRAFSEWTNPSRSETRHSNEQHGGDHGEDHDHDDDHHAGTCPRHSPTPAPTHTAHPDTPVCNAFDSNAGGSTNARAGLAARLFEVRQNSSASRVRTLIREGRALDNQLFFNDVNVPTQAFSRGFRDREGGLLNGANGQPLNEWFGIRYDAWVHLDADDQPGLYQFALLSDDGAILELAFDDHGLGMIDLVDNDGVHPTQFACSRLGVAFGRNTERKIRLSYYQGPRFHIANMLLWRRVSGNANGDSAPLPNTVQENECGRSGNDRYFDSSVVPSRATNTYNQLLGRGWKVLKPENFSLGDGLSNPCTQPSPSPTPTVTPTPSPTPTATASPTPTPTVTTSPTPTPTPSTSPAPSPSPTATSTPPPFGV